MLHQSKGKLVATFKFRLIFRIIAWSVFKQWRDEPSYVKFNLHSFVKGIMDIQISAYLGTNLNRLEVNDFILDDLRLDHKSFDWNLNDIGDICVNLDDCIDFIEHHIAPLAVDPLGFLSKEHALASLVAPVSQLLLLNGGGLAISPQSVLSLLLELGQVSVVFVSFKVGQTLNHLLRILLIKS